MAAYRQTVLQASADVENAFTTLAKFDQQQQVLKSGKASLVQSRASTLTAHRNGREIQLDVLDPDTRLQLIQDARILAMAATARAAIASNKALGGGWAPEADAKTLAFAQQ
ncbi:hypothetical protein CF70_011010 [Cupriavidus sp. SK-3]|nr:hypothetical protein CF70_011010 [Cupriavidus sp. SK-3]